MSFVVSGKCRFDKFMVQVRKIERKIYFKYYVVVCLIELNDDLR